MVCAGAVGGWEGEGGGEVRLIIAITASVGILLAALLMQAHKEKKEERRSWQAYKLAHNCKKVAEIEGGVSYGPGGYKGGLIYIVESDKTGYLCDDGITYYKEE